jgi:sugar lactone lactonase YvrE
MFTLSPFEDGRRAAMTMLSDREFAFEVVADWPSLPEDFDLGDVAAVAVDQRDDVYLFARGEHPMVVLDRTGAVLRTWGHGLFKRPHGLHFANDGALYCTDDGDHTVRKCDPDGRVLLELGVPGTPSPFMSGRPFHRCTHTALAPNGDIYVSDGYGNACVHRFAPNGRHLSSWGRSGTGPGEFYLPHNLICDGEGILYVADRENHRIQLFDGEGRFKAQWHDLHRPCALCASANARKFYVAELGPALPTTLAFPNLGPRVSILDLEGEPLARLCDGPAGTGPGQLIAPHGIAVDSHGDLYVAELSNRAWPLVFPELPRPKHLTTVHKLRAVRPSSTAEAASSRPQDRKYSSLRDERP